ncbi:PASTA domain-containing protein [Oscillibacter sp. MSJ-2]|uniref:PASTA domain-containing protein n=2 Tax=Dysosmobacter acutus TaxID=2841504 RepID=A0ABS6F8F7_9FIRM|nr:PASTA domain-containing protein [Dysosmobacter acutus]
MGIFGIATFTMLFVRLYTLQIGRHEELQQLAVKQQTRSTVVTASRGTIYDKNGNVLAISATAETVFVSPAEIAESEQDTAYIARGLSRILDVAEETILKKMEKTSSQYEVVKLRADQELADQVRLFVNGQIDDQGNEVAKDNQKRLHGVYLVTDSKRYYPYSTLAAQVIGFVGTDNTGLYGLESKYNDELTGTSGMVVTAKNAAGTDVLYQYEQYYDAENGNSLVLTLDTTVQYFLEKGIESMVAKFDAKNGATGIVMDVNTGGILAMASFPTYDLNNPSSVYDADLQATLEGLEGDAYLEALGAAQKKQWRNKAINDTYEPGSTFKILTLSTALQEGIVNKNTTFNCTGSIRVQGWNKPINCSKKAGHGSQSLMQATGNSCNPAFITMGLKIGNTTFYKYLKSFGLMEKTGLDNIGETTGIFADEKSFNSNVVSLASYAFGQTFNVTPISLITAQAACVNGGYLRTPYFVEQVLDSDGNVLYNHDSTPVRQVISEETSATVCEMLEYVVAEGTGKNGQVAGYRIGGKTGTADKTGDKNKDVVVSFVCFAPADDPQVMMLITMDSPSRTTGTYVSGGQMVAPTSSSIMSEILPWLGINPDYSAEEMVGSDTTVPNVVGSTLDQAKEKLAGFHIKTVGDGQSVTDQTPVGGAIVPGNATVILYLGAEKPTDKSTVPAVVGKTAEQANAALANAGLIMKVTGATSSSSGNVFAISQSVAAGTEVEAGTVVTVQLGDNSVLD